MRNSNRKRGQAQVEFLLTIVLFLTTLFGTFEVCRLVLCFTTLANSSRMAVRYATTHGSTNTGTANVTSASEVQNIVKNYVAGSLLDASQMTVSVSWANGTDPGDEVRVRVEYPYRPIILLPMTTTLGTQTEGIITF